jgi:hypothetical protein
MHPPEKRFPSARERNSIREHFYPHCCNYCSDRSITRSYFFLLEHKKKTTSTQEIRQFSVLLLIKSKYFTSRLQTSRAKSSLWCKKERTRFYTETAQKKSLSPARKTEADLTLIRSKSQITRDAKLSHASTRVAFWFRRRFHLRALESQWSNYAPAPAPNCCPLTEGVVAAAATEMMLLCNATAAAREVLLANNAQIRTNDTLAHPPLPAGFLLRGKWGWLSLQTN